jgi:hypothetical protein
MIAVVIVFAAVLLTFRNTTKKRFHEVSLVDFEFRTVAIVDRRYVSFTLDWWPPDQGIPFPPPDGWGPHANVLDVDLQDPKLRALVKSVGPSILRIGGTMDKIVEYHFPQYASFCSRHTAMDSRPPPCLNASRWDELHEFARATNSQIVFGLSYPETAAKDGTWNSSQAKALFLYSKQQNYTKQTTLFGFELGEELSHFQPGTLQFGHYIQAYHECAHLFREIFHDRSSADSIPGDVRPLLMGPCPGMAWPTLATWFPAFLESTKDILDVAVYHSYNQIEYPDKFYLNKTVPSGDISTKNGTCSGDTGWQAVAMKGFVDDMNRRTDHRSPLLLWLGEMGPHNGGGGPGDISSSFASSFGYIDTLGTLARLNHKVLARQTLVGGKYELLRCSTGFDGVCDFEPHPDYYVAFLWSNLMGTTVLNAPGNDYLNYMNEGDWMQDLMFHVHCSAAHPDNPERDGSITVAFSNKSPDTSFVVPTFVNGSRRVEYILQAHVSNEGHHERVLEPSHDERFDSKEVSLNGNRLQMGDTSRLPWLRGKQVSNDSTNPWMIAPASLGFVEFPNAGIIACSSAALT